jgi:TraM recognition site of TraD and TraG
MFQNLSQISERWGRDRADTLIANHNARLFGSGIADRATLEYLGAILGDEEIQKISTHRQRHRLELGSRTYSNDYKRLAAPDRIRQTQPDTALLIYGNIAPAWIGLRPWYLRLPAAHKSPHHPLTASWSPEETSHERPRTAARRPDRGPGRAGARRRGRRARLLHLSADDGRPRRPPPAISAAVARRARAASHSGGRAGSVRGSV